MSGDNGFSVNATIRHATLDDAAAAAELLDVLGYPATHAQVEARIAGASASAGTAIFVAEVSDLVVGLASFHRIPLFHEDGHLGRITSFVVAPPLRKRGVGRQLIAAVEEYAWGHGCRRVEITSGDHRADAHSFYERLGYAQESRRYQKRRGAPP
jgi:GNAT superfamily N-acetyltransferase